MNNQFILRSGKFSGKTIEFVQTQEPSYLNWIKENRPEMLKGSEVVPKQVVKKEIKFRDGPIKSIVPNLNFDNEGPADISKAYLKKMDENLDS